MSQGVIVMMIREGTISSVSRMQKCVPMPERILIKTVVCFAQRLNTDLSMCFRRGVHEKDFREDCSKDAKV